jgi:serine/alanine adding enzyme
VHTRLTNETKSLVLHVNCQLHPPANWDEYVNRHPLGSLYHDPRWASLIMRCFSHQTFFLTCTDADGALLGVLPLVFLKSRIFGRALVSMPYFNYGGLLASDDAGAAQLVSEALNLQTKLGAEYLELRQTTPIPGDWPAKSHKVLMLLTLPPDRDALWASFKTKLRTRVRRAEKEGFTLHWGKKELLADYYSVFAENMRDLGTPVYPLAFFQAILEAFPENAHIASVRSGSECVAAGFLLSYRGKMEVPWASSLRRFNRLSPNMLLYWFMLGQSIAEGCHTFDFGRSTRNSGTYQFKEQWGAAPHQSLWVYPGQNPSALPDHSPGNKKYLLATHLWRKLPLFLTNRFGPHIVKNIP